MKTIEVAASRHYQVQIGPGLLAKSGSKLRALGASGTVALVSDDTVDTLYGARVAYSLEQAGFAVCRFAFPHGEASKNLETYGFILRFLAENRLSRSDTVIALGGGVVGDMAGFAAATYLRGLRLVQMPTTLLAAVDSSVGGKTAVDLAIGKNLVGAFHQPSLVLCDVDTLGTLPAPYWADGLAEALKYGLLASPPLFEALSARTRQTDWSPLIAECVQIKADIVLQDEYDLAVRQLLNLGHTMGHALEACSHYAIRHGHAVAMGMLWAARLSERLGIAEMPLSPQIKTALIANHLPTELPFDAQALTTAASLDKKRTGDTLTLVLPKRIGKCRLHTVPMSALGSLMRLGMGPEGEEG